jgi:hypothetical protein
MAVAKGQVIGERVKRRVIVEVQDERVVDFESGADPFRTQPHGCGLPYLSPTARSGGNLASLGSIPIIHGRGNCSWQMIFLLYVHTLL